MTIETSNPATGEALASYQEMTSEEVSKTLEGVASEQAKWAENSFGLRAELLRKAGRVLRDNAGEYARLMALEMGKPLAGGRSEVEKCAWVCDYYADHAASFLADEAIETDAAKSYVAYRPLGVVLAVMPWNFPFWQVLRFAAPALMAGNGAVLKHSSNVMGCAEAIEGVFRRAGLPENIFRNLPIRAAQVGAVIEHPAVKAVTLTGSTPAGQAVASQAGAALKKTVLELGGSDAYVILEDADLERAASTFGGCRTLECSLLVGGSARLSWAYKTVNLPVVRARLLAGGVRLAGLLNWIFDPDAEAPEAFARMASEVRRLEHYDTAAMDACRGEASLLK